MAKKKTKGGPYTSVEQLKKKFFPNAYKVERVVSTEKDSSVVLDPVGGLARRLHQAMK